MSYSGRNQYYYDVTTTASQHAGIWVEGIAINPRISSVHLAVPDVVKAGDDMKWDQLEHRLLELNGNQIPQLYLDLIVRERASDLLRLVLEEEALSRLLALNRVEIACSISFFIRSQDIRNTPTHHTVDDFTITLDTDQRIEWLLQDEPEDRKAYLDRLLETARARAQGTARWTTRGWRQWSWRDPLRELSAKTSNGGRDGGRDEEDEGEGGRRSGEGSKGGEGSEGDEGDEGGRGNENEDGGGEVGESAGHIRSNEPVGERGEQRDGQAED